MLKRTKSVFWKANIGALSDIGHYWLKTENRLAGLEAWSSACHPWQPHVPHDSFQPYLYDKTGGIYSGETLDEVKPGQGVLTWSRLMETRKKQWEDGVASGAVKPASKWTPGKYCPTYSRRVGLVGYYCPPIKMHDGMGNEITISPFYIPDDLVVMQSYRKATNAIFPAQEPTAQYYVRMALERLPVRDLEQVTAHGLKDHHRRVQAGPYRRLFWRNGMPLYKGLVNFPVTPDCTLPKGFRPDPRHFVPGQSVMLTYRSEEYGYQRKTKRNFARKRPQFHRGNSDYTHDVGSIGSRTFPSRVWAGKIQPGPMGGFSQRKQQQVVAGVDARHRLVYIVGSIRATIGTAVILTDDVHTPKPSWLPFPSFVADPSENTEKMSYVEANLFAPGKLHNTRDVLYAKKFYHKHSNVDVPPPMLQEWHKRQLESAARNSKALFGGVAELPPWSDEEYAELLADVAPPFTAGPENVDWQKRQHGAAYMKPSEMLWLKAQSKAALEGVSFEPPEGATQPDFGRLADAGLSYIHAFEPALQAQTDWTFPHHDPPRISPRLDGPTAAKFRNEFEQGGKSWSRWLVTGNLGFAPF